MFFYCKLYILLNYEKRYVYRITYSCIYRSSHNLHDPMRIGTLPSTGLVSRQQSSPNLNPSTSHMNAPSNVQGTEAERFYQNLSIYRNQDSTVKQQISPQQSDDRYNLIFSYFYISTSFIPHLVFNHYLIFKNVLINLFRT